MGARLAFLRFLGVGRCLGMRGVASTVSSLARSLRSKLAVHRTVLTVSFLRTELPLPELLQHAHFPPQPGCNVAEPDHSFQDECPYSLRGF